MQKLTTPTGQRFANPLQPSIEYGTDQSNLYTIQLPSGYCQNLGQLPTAVLGFVRAGGYLYGLSASDQILRVDPNNPGSAVSLGSLGVLAPPGPGPDVTGATGAPLSYLPRSLFGDGGPNTFALYQDWVNWGMMLYRIDLTSLQASFVGPVAGSPMMGGAAWDGTSAWCGDAATGNLVKINPQTGQATVVSTGPGYDSMTFVAGQLYGLYLGFAALYQVDRNTGAATFPPAFLTGMVPPPWLIGVSSN